MVGWKETESDEFFPHSFKVMGNSHHGDGECLYGGMERSTFDSGGAHSNGSVQCL